MLLFERLSDENHSVRWEVLPPFDFYEMVGYWDLDLQVCLDLLPNEVMRIIEGKRKRAIDEQNNLITQAYLVASLSRAEKLPRLETLLIKPPKRATPQEREAIRKLAEEFKKRQITRW